MQSKEHWDKVYSTKPTDGVSWYQEHAESSLRLIQQAGVSSSAEIIDVGGGASTLVDDLIAHGFTHLSVLDLSAAALAATKQRLGSRANEVRWIVGDITDVPLPPLSYDVWHDRAVFHFLTAEAERAAYVEAVLRCVKPGGFVIVATFSEDGPTQCSGLPVKRYTADELHDEFGAPFELLRHEKEEHHTPFGTTQNFVYCFCRKS
ncbi:class I SAM-dependent methyltransferase [Pseudomonas arsenicoxydans]|uniref:Class I SAM-dependent methyltransferase n=1 Tax=Pseudomonas arsenicoxydans TaxID=702115 RepID=A0A502HJ10_9PSED|nr:class I SAM-dependent methyltransferase [Pseudomonas arsenicoxydans]TPG74651.1 class I SAM-dependent methyltransferase [Pseudomonas arsenicoxydans]